MNKPNQQNSRPAGPQDPGAGRPQLEDAFKEPDVDERRVRHADEDGRGDRGIEDAIRSELGGELLSDEDYENLVRNEFEQTALPKPPALDGWHLCWLTTTSQYDTIGKRQRIGYRPVRTSEMPGFDPSNGQSLAQYGGFVTCNEMVLHKIPERYFQKMMEYFHHKKPAQDSQTTLEKIKAGLEKEQDSTGRDLGEILGTGFLDMERTAKRTSTGAPRFSS